MPAKKSPKKKIRIGWFSYTCCEDNTVVFTELLNDHWQEWKELFDFRHVRALQTHNVMDEFDIAFIEGAVSTKEQEKRVKDIRKRSKILVAVGSCAVIGMPAGQRNQFDKKRQEEIEFLLARFHELPKVLKVSDVVKVDAEVPGCPMDTDIFLKTVTSAVESLMKK